MNKLFSSFFEAAERTPFGRLTLRAKLTAGNMLITFLAILLMGAFVYFRTREASIQLTTQLEENIRNRVEASLLTTGEEQAARLDSFFASMGRNTSIIGSTISDLLSQKAVLGDGAYWNAQEQLFRLPSGSWDNSNSEVSSIFIPANVNISSSLASKLNILKHTELFIPSIISDNPDIVAIYFGGISSETIYYPNINLAEIVPPDFDVTGRLWYVNASPENNPRLAVVWSAPYQDAALNGLVVTTSVPVLDENKRFQGVAAMDIQLTQITSLVAGIEVGESGYAFVVDNNNRLIALPEQGYDDFGITDENAKLGEIMDTATLPEAAPEFFDILERVVADSQGVFNINIGDTERIVAYHQIPQVQYKLVTIVPSSEMLREAVIVNEQIAEETRSTTSGSFILIIAIFLVASVASLAIGNRFTSPLRQLTNTANEIIAGNLNAKAEIQSQDEIGVLASSLNAMTFNLRELIQSLEQRVVERTSALRDELQKGERRGKQYEAIAKVTQAINQTQNLQELLPQVSEVISRQFDFYHVGIFLNDASNEYAVLSAANSDGGQRMLKRGHQLKIGEQGIVGYVTGTNQPRIALDVGEDAAYFNNPDLPQTRSEMALPLTISGQVIGALDVQSTEPNAFSDEDVDVLSTLADQVSIALQNARLYEQTQKSLAEAEAVFHQYFQETWSRLSQEQKVTGFRYTPIGAIPLGKSNQEMGTEDKLERKSVSVPIVIRGQTVGKLSVLVPKQEMIQTDQMDLIHAVADRVALFAENARLFDQTARRAERERLVADITTKIRETNDPQEMIETAVNELRQALNVSRIEVIPQRVASPDK